MTTIEGISAALQGRWPGADVTATVHAKQGVVQFGVKHGDGQSADVVVTGILLASLDAGTAAAAVQAGLERKQAHNGMALEVMHGAFNELVDVPVGERVGRQMQAFLAAYEVIGQASVLEQGDVEAGQRALRGQG